MKISHLWNSEGPVDVRAWVSILALVLLIAIVSIISRLPLIDTENEGDKPIQPVIQYTDHYGTIQPQVVDGFSEEPIEDAVVVIPETGQRFVTDQDGLTALIRVPILEDVHFTDISPKPWGEITLMIYKKGYIEYVLLHAHAWENQTRKGPKILLFPEVEGEKNEPFFVVEGPHRLWVQELVEKYRP